MDFNLLISAQPLQLAPDLRTTLPVHGLMVVKNVQEKTYLRVTPAQWALLRLFEDRQTVPAVLAHAIRERLCVRLGEFYELILKAERAGVLLGPQRPPRMVKVCDWRGSLNPRRLGGPLVFLLLAGLGLALGFRPELPSSPEGLAMGALILLVTSNFSEYIRGCLLHGAGGEVYRPPGRWWPPPPAFRIDTSDAVMLPRDVQDVLLIAQVAVLAVAAGITSWHAPAWSLLPLLGLMVKLQPGPGGGRFPTVLRLGRDHELSDAEHSFLFPPNRTTRARWQSLVRCLRQTNTWVRFCYAVIWTVAVGYLAARLADAPPWTYAFWEAHGDRIAVAGLGLLLLLGFVCAAVEFILFARIRWQSWNHSFRQWRARWLGGRRRLLDEPGRLEVIARAPALRPLSPPERQELARALEPVRHRPWRALRSFEGPEPAQVGLIVSGRVAVRREEATGRARRVQVLGPGDLIGLHDSVDPEGTTYRLRSLSPLTLLVLPRAAATDLILNRVARSTLGNMVLKVPFLRGIPLCRNWHQQAIERFAQVSSLDRFPEGKRIFWEGQIIDRFYILFEGDAQVSGENRSLGVIHTGEFFGEIGLLQNSDANATVTALQTTRTLTIARTEFLRFVTHNYAVALELERVSSKRLGRPIFPVRQSDLGDRMQP